MGFAPLLLWIFALAAWADESPPFVPGEVLKFDLKWEFIKAGEATLAVRPATRVDGTEALHFVMKAKSLPYLDLFYKVRDRIDAYTDTAVTRSLLYEKKQREGKTHREIVVTFDWEKNQALYTNFGKPKAPISLMEGTFDPLSAFFFVRTIPPAVDLTVERPVTDGKKNVIGRAHYVKRETIEVDGRSYDTFLIEPDIEHVGGVFEKSEDAKIQVWITADHRRIPVRIKSKVIVGSFIGELVSAEGTAEAPEASSPAD